MAICWNTEVEEQGMLLPIQRKSKHIHIHSNLYLMITIVMGCAIAVSACHNSLQTDYRTDTGNTAGNSSLTSSNPPSTTETIPVITPSSAAPTVSLTAPSPTKTQALSTTPPPKPALTPKATVTPLASKYGTVTIPTNFTPGIPENIFIVPQAQQKAWFSYLTLTPGSGSIRMIFHADLSKISIKVTNGLFSGKPRDSAVTDTMVNVGTIAVLIQSGKESKAEILSVNLKSVEGKWEIIPVKNTQKTTIHQTEQLRMINPRNPITRAEADAITNLQAFDPSPYAATGKAPFRMRTVCIAPLKEMLKKADSDGIDNITVRDTYRSYQIQQNLFQSVIRYYQGQGMSYQEAYNRTETETAVPGTSEHHNGYTADVITKNTTMDQAFGKTAFGKWLSGNCRNYGFIIRYPEGKQFQTTKKYEPWHVRFVGIPTARLLSKYNIVLEEFHAYLAKNQYILWSCSNTQSETGKQSDYLYIRCSSAGQIILPDVTDTEGKVLLSTDGTGSVVLLYRFE